MTARPKATVARADAGPSPATRPLPRRVWFHRDYHRFTGGHVKHAHYFDHVARTAGYEPVMTFSRDSDSVAVLMERARLWPAEGRLAPDWRPAADDILFVAGTDWRYVDARGLDDLTNVRINLIQGVRHAQAGSELYGYLDRRAVRICVSQEVADAITATGRIRGPVLTIPNGIEMTPFQSRDGTRDRRRHEVTIIAYKAPNLARELSALLTARGVAHHAVFDFLDRRAFLELLADTKTAVCLPFPEEGFYLPALEAMAAGCTVVTMDCIGNRGFCRPGDNCLIGRDAESLADAAARAQAMPPAVLEGFRERARRTVRAHALDTERARFQAVLGEIDHLWRAEGLRSLPGRQPPRTEKPLVDFMIIGAQKCGTTALGQFLGKHPEIGMSSQKEVHLFDAPDYVPGTPVADIDAGYRKYFADDAATLVRGEATPSYMYLGVAAEVKRYNPDLKLIVLLRDPVERALSEYYMQKRRGRETRPLWLAVLLEPWRLGRDRDPWRERSPTREHGYRRRGLYSLQLRAIFRHFERDRVLVVRRTDLLNDHDATMHGVLAFLGVSATVGIARAVVFAGEEPRRPHRLARALLKLSYVLEFRRLRRLGIAVA